MMTLSIPLESDALQFSCSACGSCCSHIRGFIPEADKKFIEQYAFGKLPVVQLVPVEHMTFPLWDWEASRFKQWGKDVGIDPHVKPLRAMYDQVSGKAIILTYFMDAEHDACPMLTAEKKCSIYHTKRAYVCRLFPFNKSPFSFAGDVDKDQLFGECGAMEKIIQVVPGKVNELVPFLQKAFPHGEFLNAVQNDIIIEWANKTIIELMKKKMLRPLLNVPYGEIKEKIDKAQKIDFTEFLVECGYWVAEQRKQMIARFDANEDAGERIAPLLHR
jgi:Fe-S-cluster containining protein